MFLEHTNLTMTVAGVALLVGATIVVVGLTTINWLVA